MRQLTTRDGIRLAALREACRCRNCVGGDGVRQFTTRDGIRLAA